MALPVVLVHGIRVSGGMWRAPAALLARERPVATPDLPGHGVRRGEGFTLDAATRAVADAIDELGGRALVAGLSLGGYAAIATAARFPDKVAGLVAIGCTAVPTAAGARPFLMGHRLLSALPGQGEAASRWVYQRLLGRPAADAMCAGGLATEVIPDVVAALVAFDPLAALRGYPGRVWLVNGSRDHFRAGEREFLAACRAGRLLSVPRAGHLVSLTHPAVVAELIGTAAGELEPVAAGGLR